jgi:hypothetical protein
MTVSFMGRVPSNAALGKATATRSGIFREMKYLMLFMAITHALGRARRRMEMRFGCDDRGRLKNRHRFAKFCCFGADPDTDIL